MNKKLAQLILIITLSLNLATTVLAQGSPTAEKTTTGGNTTVNTSNGITAVINDVGSKTGLTNYDAGHPKQSYQAGSSQLTSIIYYILDFFKYILGGIAVLMLTISGFKLILSGRGVEDAMSKEKETLRYSFTGLVVIIIADQLIRNVFFGMEGEMYRSGADLDMAAQQGVKLTNGFTGLLRIFIPSIAILYFVIAGFRLLTSRGDTEKLGKAKTQMAWSIGGIVLAGLAEVIVYQVIFPNQGNSIPDPNAFARLMVTITNFISGFISTISVTMIIYAGYLYVISMGGDQLEKAKTILKGAIIGLLISMAAFGLVNTFVKVEPLQSAPPPTEVAIPNT